MLSRILVRIIDCLTMWLLMVSIGTLAMVVYASICALLIGSVLP